MEDFMNEPVPYTRTDEDIIKEYDKWQDKKKVAAIWGITVKEVTEILKQK